MVAWKLNFCAYVWNYVLWIHTQLDRLAVVPNKQYTFFFNEVGVIAVIFYCGKFKVYLRPLTRDNSSSDETFV